ncbi:MAG: hydrogenase formation protein HypD [Candidatus Krumholzibacteria bacterium]|nr:hydrogenase formation protein HypD [Candidatus Krumholzibacteria bacterium]
MSGSGIMEEYRDPALANALAREIRGMRLPKPIALMHVCGTHEHTIARAGMRAVLPPNVRLIAGPGCPVCVCPAGDIDRAIDAARRDKVVVATFGDMFRVPASETSFEKAKAEGADIRIVYSPLDAVNMARDNPGKQVVFMAVGFETTAAPIAAALCAEPPANFSILLSMRLIPPALRFLLERSAGTLDGFILPGHVSAIIGRTGYEFLEKEWGVPGVIAGFEALDVLGAVRDLVAQAASGGKGTVVNGYKRVVHENGNAKAREMMFRLFEPADVPWRGIGVIPASGLVLRKEHERFDAGKRLALADNACSVDVRPGCQCHRVILGEAEPEACSLFGSECTPRSAYGPCMVSSEGTCRARFLYRPVGS